MGRTGLSAYVHFAAVTCRAIRLMSSIKLCVGCGWFLLGHTVPVAGDSARHIQAGPDARAAKRRTLQQRASNLDAPVIYRVFNCTEAISAVSL